MTKPTFSAALENALREPHVLTTQQHANALDHLFQANGIRRRSISIRISGKTNEVSGGTITITAPAELIDRIRQLVTTPQFPRIYAEPGEATYNLPSMAKIVIKQKE